jgi:2-haloacid dehalogenase
MPQPLAAVVFDAYGTLLDVHAAVGRHAARLGAVATSFSADWRAKQLEYTWTLSMTGPGHRKDFWAVTRDALAWTAARHGVTDAPLLEALLSAYRSLDAYPEVLAMLAALKAKGLLTAILSNGTPDMLAEATRPIAPLLDAVISVEEAGIFKPDPRVYALATARLGLPNATMGFVSANPWDTQAAHHAGFRAIRVNRQGAPDEYGLAAAGVPSLPDLASLPALLGA